MSRAWPNATASLMYGKNLSLFSRYFGANSVPSASLPDVLRAVDDLQVAVLVEVAGVAGVEPAVVRLRLGGRLGVLVVLLEQPRRADQDLAARRSTLISTPFTGGPDGVGLHLAVRLHADEHRGLGRAVELLQVDADRAVEHEQVGPDRLARGVGDAHPAHAEHVAQRPVDEQVAEPVQQPVDERHRLLRVEDLRRRRAARAP